MNDCIFCKIVKGEIPATKVYEDDEFLAFLDINPVNPGHTLVIPKEHQPTFSHAPKELVCKTIGVVQDVAKVVQQATGALGFNIGINNGSVAGQAVEHLHVHIMPRFEQDGHQLWKGQPYDSPETMKILADKIRLCIS